MKLALAVLFVASLAHCASVEPVETPPAKATHGKEPWETVARFQAKALEEISGLAASGRREDVFWSHNDSGGQAALHALQMSGAFLGSVTLEGVRNIDWEDMAAFTHRGEPHLLIADTGDNEKKRSFVHLHAVVEPKAAANGRYEAMTASVAWTLTVRYADGPQDCEAIGIDPQGKRVFLLNKDSGESVIYAVPLFPNQEPIVAERVAVLPKISNATRDMVAILKAGVLGTRATAMDVSADGRTAAVLTYTDIRIFRRPPQQAWSEAFTQRPHVLALPAVYQPEAACFSPDGKALYVSSEETPTPLVRHRLTAP